MERIDAGFANQDVVECTAYGKLWYVAKVSSGRWGIFRLRRHKNGLLRTDGKLIWKTPWAQFADPVMVGKLIFQSNAGTSVLIDWPAEQKGDLR